MYENVIFTRITHISNRITEDTDKKPNNRNECFINNTHSRTCNSNAFFTIYYLSNYCLLKLLQRRGEP